MLRKPLLTLVLALLLTSNGGPAAATEPKDLPRPTDYVSDLAHVLSDRAVNEVDEVCAQLDHSTADTQIAVVTIPTIDGADVAEYAKALANTWKVGKKESNRGILVLLAINDHKWRIAISRGLETSFTDSEAASIGKKMTPRLRAKDFDGAVILAVRGIEQVLAGHKKP